MSTNHMRTYPIKVPTSEYPLFSDRLTVAMRIRGFSVDQLASEIYLSKSAICNYRSGSRLPDINVLRHMALALHVSADFLLGLEEYIYI